MTLPSLQSVTATVPVATCHVTSTPLIRPPDRKLGADTEAARPEGEAA